MSFESKVAVVTGASSGIGAETAVLLGQQGATVILVARNPDRLNAVAERILDAGGKAIVIRADITNAEDVNTAVAKISADYGTVDYLVNCAGVYLPTPAGDTDVNVLDAMLNTNLRGTILMCNAVVVLMKKQKSGAIVNIASAAAVFAVSGYAVYCATKAGVLMFSRALAREVAPFDVRVNIIAPGNTATPMNSEVRSNADIMNGFAQVTPSPRVFSPPEEMAETILYLLSDKAKALYGSVIVADEGLTLGL